MPGESVWRDLIVGYRKKHALTQADAAQRLNVSQQTISRWESGKQEPDATAQASLRQHLGMVAMTLRDSWIQRVSLSAGFEFLVENGWNLIALSPSVATDEMFADAVRHKKPLLDLPLLKPLVPILIESGLFVGEAALVRIRLTLQEDGRREGRICDLWPVLTGTDEILVHAVTYPYDSESTHMGQDGLRVVDYSIVPRDAFGHKTA